MFRNFQITLNENDKGTFFTADDVTPRSWSYLLSRDTSTGQIPFGNFKRLEDFFVFSNPINSIFDSVRVLRGDQVLISLKGSDYGSRVWMSYENYDEEIVLNEIVNRAILLGV